ncbi:MAG: Stp1/IreP family PP2C-type Ser/Thr phosphatase [Gammaproteobacteria bacterium]|nr:MAG: Stp1/IreP family PP2C-type Ser/Thr phosphatase [Gammaproteobacteria bacterium]
MAGLTDPGRVRPENEDCIAFHPDIGFAVLADGMGGHQAGEVASRMAVDVMTRFCTDVFASNERNAAGGEPCAYEHETLKAAAEAANTAIFEMARHTPEYAGMGATLVTVLFQNGHLCVGHVGDSRLYRLRAGKLAQLTQDHSVVQELLNRGLVTPEQARQSVSKNLVTRALGVDLKVQADFDTLSTEPDDLYLLCSDGLNDVLTDSEIEYLLNTPDAGLGDIAQRLVDAANAAGGPDNISVILARTAGRFRRARKAAQKLQSALENV